MESVVSFESGDESLRIESKNVPELLERLQAANANDQLWFAFKNTGGPIEGNDILFFPTGKEAIEFVDNQKSIPENYTALPIEATQKVLEKVSPTETLIVRDAKEIIKYQDNLNFNASSEMMSFTMRRNNWKDMDPETFHLFIADLKGIHDESLRGKQTVEQLVQTHWPDLLINSKLLPNNSNNHLMNEKNLDYLKDNIKYHGFGESLAGELEGHLKKGPAEFSLPFKTEVNKKTIEATLHFRKSDSTDLYFFNKYDIRAQLEKKDETLSQTFYINKGHGVTLKEAYNLLNGRAVHKELTDKENQKYQAWIQFDFGVRDKNGNFERKQYHQNYGYDLKEALSYYPVKELANADDRMKIMKSLEKGNVQQVTLEVSGKEMKVFMEANPQYKSVIVYNGKMERLNQEQRQELMVKPLLGAAKELAQGQGKGEAKEQSKDLAQDVKKAKNDLTDDIDLPKKNNSRKKGMSV